jgi:hypothetical protein
MEAGMRKLAILGLALALALSMAAVAAATPTPTFTIYNDISTWVAACPDSKLQDFDEAFPGGLNPGVSVTTVNGFVDTTTSLWHDIVVPGGATTTWTFATPIHGLGGFFDLAVPGGPGTGIDVFADGFQVSASPSIPNTYDGGFWGFLSPSTFTSITFASDGQSGIQETYTLDDLRYCPVPVPPAVLLFGSGLLGLVGFRLRRK